MKIWFLSLISSRWDHPWSEHERRPPGALAGHPQEPGPAAEEDALPDRQLHWLNMKSSERNRLQFFTQIVLEDASIGCGWTIGRSRTWKRVRPLVSNDYFAQAPQLTCMVVHQARSCAVPKSAALWILILVDHHVSEKSWALFAHLAYLWNGILSLIKPIIIIINCCHNHRKSVLRHLEYDNLSWYVSERYFSSDCRAILLKLDQQMDLPPFIMIILIITSSCQFLWIYQIELCAILGSLE